jgi:hypothetical protein
MSTKQALTTLSKHWEGTHVTADGVDKISGACRHLNRLSGLWGFGRHALFFELSISSERNKLIANARPARTVFGGPSHQVNRMCHGSSPE